MSKTDPADWTPTESEPTPREAVRQLEQHPDVSEAGIVRDREGTAVDAVMVERVDAVPIGVARILYRRGLEISDVSDVAAHSRKQVTATTPATTVTVSKL
jgi:hypothetical protein